ncbi:MAG: hypothetical protein JXQ87_12795 [Bacteroidia bacterium]
MRAKSPLRAVNDFFIYPDKCIQSNNLCDPNSKGLNSILVPFYTSALLV